MAKAGNIFYDKMAIFSGVWENVWYYWAMKFQKKSKKTTAYSGSEELKIHRDKLIKNDNLTSNMFNTPFYKELNQEKNKLLLLSIRSTVFSSTKKVFYSFLSLTVLIHSTTWKLFWFSWWVLYQRKQGWIVLIHSITWKLFWSSKKTFEKPLTLKPSLNPFYNMEVYSDGSDF